MSAFSQTFVQKQLQTLSLSYGMKLSLQLLQLNSLQLKTYLEKELMDNPMFEVDMPMQYATGQHMDFWDIPDESRSLQTELLLQIKDQHCNLALIEGILHHCDRNGYLLLKKDALAHELHVSLPELHHHLKLIHSCEPVGIAAADLSECLMLQLQHQYPKEWLALQLAQHDLQDIARNRMEKLAQHYQVTQKEILHAVKVIQSLDPRPASAYDLEHITFIKPDVLLTAEDGNITIAMPNYFQIVEQDYYKGHSLNPEETAYIKEKQQQGRAILDCLHHRKQTLSAIMQVMVEKQEAFLLHQGHLSYLIMREIGEALSMHETTISRAMKDKYFEFEGVVYPMRSLLCKQVHHTSVNEILFLIKELIAQEDEEKPLSDQMLSQLLQEKGIRCSRRTITKYRDEHHIPSTQTRKRLKEKRHE